MKFKLISAAFILAGSAAFSLHSLAADTNAGSAPDQPVKVTPAPHSHMQEKGYGPAAKAPEADKAKKDEETNAARSTNPANDRSKHFHPRDR